MHSRVLAPPTDDGSAIYCHGSRRAAVTVTVFTSSKSVRTEPVWSGELCGIKTHNPRCILSATHIRRLLDEARSPSQRMHVAMKPTLPVIRVTKAKAGTSTKPAQAFDVGIYDVLVKVVNSAGRLRSRIDGCEARLEHLEALLNRSGR